MQTDIVMLLTPHIVRTHALTQKDFSPLYVGTQGNLGLAGPPPLIQPPGGAASQPPSSRRGSGFTGRSNGAAAVSVPTAGDGRRAEAVPLVPAPGLPTPRQPRRRPRSRLRLPRQQPSRR